MAYHHYISAFHLAEFTIERQRRAQIWVLDLEQHKQWKAAVDRAGGENRYNEVQGIVGLDPEAIESVINQQLENHAAIILHQINDNQVLPDKKELITLLRYIALISFNNPARRGAMNDAQEKMLRFMAQMMVASPETFELAQSECRRDGVPLLGEIDYKELKELLESERFTYDMSPKSHLTGLGKHVGMMTVLLQERYWSLLVATPGSPNFICGDKPVVLNWTIEKQSELEATGSDSTFLRPGFMSEGTELIVPLGSRTCLLGTYEKVSPRILAGKRVVAEVNGRMLGSASRFVYSEEEVFIFRDSRNIIRDSTPLVN